MADRDVIAHEFQPDLTGPVDPYRRLGVTRDALAADIKRAWRTLVQTYHPDHGGDADLFRDLKLCYETLIDPERRAQYDQSGVLKDKAPDTAAADAMSALVAAFERTLQAMIQNRQEPRHVDMVGRIKAMLDVMEGELFKEEQQIKQSLPEWESVVRRFKVKKGENIFAHHITAKLGEFRKRLEAIERHKKALMVAKKLIKDYSFDWESPDPFEQSMMRVQGFAQVFGVS